jgi:hypothetical protein
MVQALEGPRGLLAIGGLLALALIVSILLPAGSATPSPTPPPTTLAGQPPPSAPPQGEPAATTTLAAKPKPSPSASQEPSPEPTPPRTARLTLAIEHNVKEGRLTVLVDQKIVLDKAISGKETKRVLVFRGRKGELFEVIDLPAGDHTIRVEAQDGEEKKAGQIQGAFKKGEARLLEVKIGGRVELEWR